MTIHNAQDAMRFVVAWSGATAGRQASMFELVAESMQGCATYCAIYGHEAAAQDYREARAVLLNAIPYQGKVAA